MLKRALLACRRRSPCRSPPPRPRPPTSPPPSRRPAGPPRRSRSTPAASRPRCCAFGRPRARRPRARSVHRHRLLCRDHGPRGRPDRQRHSAGTRPISPQRRGRAPRSPRIHERTPNVACYLDAGRRLGARRRTRFDFVMINLNLSRRLLGERPLPLPADRPGRVPAHRLPVDEAGRDDRGDRPCRQSRRRHPRRGRGAAPDRSGRRSAPISSAPASSSTANRTCCATRRTITRKTVFDPAHPRPHRPLRLPLPPAALGEEGPARGRGAPASAGTPASARKSRAIWAWSAKPARGGMVGERGLRRAPARTPCGSAAAADSGAAAGRHGARTSAAACAGSSRSRGSSPRPNAAARIARPDRGQRGRRGEPRLDPRRAPSNGSQRPRIAASGIVADQRPGPGPEPQPVEARIAADREALGPLDQADREARRAGRRPSASGRRGGG